MEDKDSDYGLKKINISDYKLKQNNNSFFIVLIIIIISFYLLKKNNIYLLTKTDENVQSIDQIDKTFIKDSSYYAIDSVELEIDMIDSDAVLTPVISEVKSLSGKYYIIAGSFSNYNISLNKANILVDSGYSAFIISPLNQNNMYRVAVNKYDELNLAKENLILYKEKLNNELWILKH